MGRCRTPKISTIFSGTENVGLKFARCPDTGAHPLTLPFLGIPYPRILILLIMYKILGRAHSHSLPIPSGLPNASGPALPRSVPGLSEVQTYAVRPPMVVVSAAAARAGLQFESCEMFVPS